MNTSTIAAAVSDFWDFMEPWQYALIGLMLLLIVALAASIVMAEVNRRKRREERRAILLGRYKQWRAWVETNDRLPEVDVDVILKGDEIAHYASPAELIETRSVRTTNFAGASTRLGGVNVGGGRAHSRSHDEWRNIASGQLVITSARLIFDGDAQSRTVPLSSIVSVKADADAVSIASSSREKIMVFRNVNGPIIRDTIQILSN